MKKVLVHARQGDDAPAQAEAAPLSQIGG